jgi:indolepyruvate decarboxylase
MSSPALTWARPALSDTNFALSHRKLDPRRTVLAIDRTVHTGHHLYPDIPLADLVTELDAPRAFGC